MKNDIEENIYGHYPKKMNHFNCTHLKRLFLHEQWMHCPVIRDKKFCETLWSMPDIPL